MDEQLKARLIGATVLVVLAVLLVPELLSGRKVHSPGDSTGQPRGTRSYTINLGGGITEGTPPASPSPARPAEVAPQQRADQADTPAPTSEPEPQPEPRSAAATPVAREPAPQAEPAPSPSRPSQAAAAPEPASTPSVASASPVPAAAGGRYSVQVGAFGSTETARRLVADLRRDGYPAYVAPLQKQGKTLHRVRVGPAATREEADRLAARLKGKGLPATVVTGG